VSPVIPTSFVIILMTWSYPATPILAGPVRWVERVLFSLTANDTVIGARSVGI
jgi:hypothetical protein